MDDVERMETPVVGDFQRAAHAIRELRYSMNYLFNERRSQKALFSSEEGEVGGSRVLVHWYKLLDDLYFALYERLRAATSNYDRGLDTDTPLPALRGKGDFSMSKLLRSTVRVLREAKAAFSVQMNSKTHFICYSQYTGPDLDGGTKSQDANGSAAANAPPQPPKMLSSLDEGADANGEMQGAQDGDDDDGDDDDEFKMDDDGNWDLDSLPTAEVADHVGVDPVYVAVRVNPNGTQYRAREQERYPGSVYRCFSTGRVWRASPTLEQLEDELYTLALCLYDSAPCQERSMLFDIDVYDVHRKNRAETRLAPITLDEEQQRRLCFFRMFGLRTCMSSMVWGHLLSGLALFLRHEYGQAHIDTSYFSQAVRLTHSVELDEEVTRESWARFMREFGPLHECHDNVIRLCTLTEFGEKEVQEAPWLREWRAGLQVEARFSEEHVQSARRWNEEYGKTSARHLGVSSRYQVIELDTYFNGMTRRHMHLSTLVAKRYNALLLQIERNLSQWKERVWKGVGIATKVRAPSINIDDVDDDVTEARLLRLSVTKADEAALSTPDVLPDGADVPDEETRVVYEELPIDLFHDGFVLHTMIHRALTLECDRHMDFTAIPSSVELFDVHTVEEDVEPIPWLTKCIRSLAEQEWVDRIIFNQEDSISGMRALALLVRQSALLVQEVRSSITGEFFVQLLECIEAIERIVENDVFGEDLLAPKQRGSFFVLLCGTVLTKQFGCFVRLLNKLDAVPNAAGDVLLRTDRDTGNTLLHCIATVGAKESRRYLDHFFDAIRKHVDAELAAGNDARSFEEIVGDLAEWRNFSRATPAMVAAKHDNSTVVFTLWSDFGVSLNEHYSHSSLLDYVMRHLLRQMRAGEDDDTGHDMGIWHKRSLFKYAAKLAVPREYGTGIINRRNADHFSPLYLAASLYDIADSAEPGSVPVPLELLELVVFSMITSGAVLSSLDDCPRASDMHNVVGRLIVHRMSDESDERARWILPELAVRNRDEHMLQLILTETIPYFFMPLGMNGQETMFATLASSSALPRRVFTAAAVYETTLHGQEAGDSSDSEEDEAARNTRRNRSMSTGSTGSTAGLSKTPKSLLHVAAGVPDQRAAIVEHLLRYEPSDPDLLNLWHASAKERSSAKRRIKVWASPCHDTTDRRGRTALHVVAQQSLIATSGSMGQSHQDNTVEIAEALLPYVDINARDYRGYTAVHYAADAGHLDLVRVLLEANANILLPTEAEHKSSVPRSEWSWYDANTRQPDGMTALHFAAKYGHSPVVTLLVDHLCKMHQHDEASLLRILDAVDYEGRTPLLLALERHHLMGLTADALDERDQHARSSVAEQELKTRKRKFTLYHGPSHLHVDAAIPNPRAAPAPKKTAPKAPPPPSLQASTPQRKQTASGKRMSFFAPRREVKAGRRKPRKLRPASFQLNLLFGEDGQQASGATVTRSTRRRMSSIVGDMPTIADDEVGDGGDPYGSREQLLVSDGSPRGGDLELGVVNGRESPDPEGSSADEMPLRDSTRLRNLRCELVSLLLEEDMSELLRDGQRRGSSASVDRRSSVRRASRVAHMMDEDNEEMSTRGAAGPHGGLQLLGHRVSSTRVVRLKGRFEDVVHILLRHNASISTATSTSGMKLHEFLDVSSAWRKICNTVTDLDQRAAEAADQADALGDDADDHGFFRKQTAVNMFSTYKLQREAVFDDPVNQIVIDHHYHRTVKKRLMTHFLAYCVFLTLLTVLALAETTRDSLSAHYLHRSLHQTLVESSFKSTSGGEAVTWDEISRKEDVMAWLQGPFLDSFYPTSAASSAWDGSSLSTLSSALVNGQMRLIGVPRLRQVRSREEDCPAMDNERDLPCLSNALDWSTEPFGPSAQWKYLSEDDVSGVGTWGRYHWYPGGGHIVKLPPVTIASSRGNTLSELVDLRDNYFVDRRTRALFVEFTVYSTNEDHFVNGYVLAEFPRSGGVFTSANFPVSPLRRYDGPNAGLRIALEVVVLLMLCGWLVARVRRDCVAYGPTAWSTFLYDLFFWRLSFLNWVQTVSLLMVFVLHIVGIFEEAAIDWDKGEGFTQVDRLGLATRLETQSWSVLVFVSWLKTLDYLKAFSPLNRLIVTIELMVKELWTFAIIFLVVLAAFASGEYISFGYQTSDSLTWMYTFASRFSVASTGRPLETWDDVSRVLGIVYPLLFVAVVSLLLVNVLIAILNAAYLAAHTKAAKSQWAKRQFGEIHNVASYETSTGFSGGDNVAQSSKHALLQAHKKVKKAVSTLSRRVAVRRSSKLRAAANSASTRELQEVDEVAMQFRSRSATMGYF